MNQNKKCNIAFLTHGDRNIGGGEQSWYFLITKINQDLFTPIVFYSEKNRVIDQIEKEQIPVINVKINKKITSLYRDQVRYNPLSLLIYIGCLLIAIWRLFRLLKKHEIHILHVHDNLSKIIGVPASKLANIKIITNCNDQLGKALIDRILLFYQRRFMDKVFCVTNYIGNMFAKKGVIPNNVVVVYSAIEPKCWTRTGRKRTENLQGIQKEKVILGIVAVFDRVKGHQCLFQAIKTLVAQGFTDFSCLVIGDGRERDNLHKLVTENGIERYVEFRGFVHNLKEILNELDILVVPSLQESFGMAAVEAMAMELPVIASKVGGLPEVVKDGETGILVPPADPQSLANAIKFLINNPATRFEMGQRGKERVNQKFDIDKNLRISEKIIWELVNGDDLSMGDSK